VQRGRPQSELRFIIGIRSNQSQKDDTPWSKLALKPVSSSISEADASPTHSAHRIRAFNSWSSGVSTMMNLIIKCEILNLTHFAAAGELPKPPEKPIVFLEGSSSTTWYGNCITKKICIDLGDAALASAVSPCH
jgi:hypothetical protein